MKALSIILIIAICCQGLINVIDATANSTTSTVPGGAKNNRQKNTIEKHDSPWWEFFLYSLLAVGVVGGLGIALIYVVYEYRKNVKDEKYHEKWRASLKSVSDSPDYEEEVDSKKDELDKQRLSPQHVKDLEKSESNQDLQKLMSSQTAINGSSELRKATATMRSTKKDQATIELIKSMLAKTDSHLHGVKLMSAEYYCRPQIKVRQDTQVTVKIGDKERPLNLNRMLDLANHTIFIGQPPGVLQSDGEYWTMIWEQEIGVLVWIGNHKPGDEMSFPEYAVFEKRKYKWSGQNTFGDNLSVTMKKRSRLSQNVACYRMETNFYDRFRCGRRHLLIFRINEWPAWNQITGISDLVNVMSKAHAYLFRKTIESKYWPGETFLRKMMVHCPSGVHQSVTFGVMYINRQMLLRHGKVNVAGALEHIAKHRYKSWDGLSDEQMLGEIKLIYVVLEMVANDLNEGKLLELKEKGDALIKMSFEKGARMKSVKNNRASVFANDHAHAV